MYRLMLVDDEPEICEGLQKVVDMAALGFVVVGEARNGMEALQLAETVRPDLVITDIRMPVMDGLTMAARMKKMLPMVRFVVLSGYDEFEYARRAIELTAMRYLLKPISSKEIIEILRQIRAALDEEFGRLSDVARLRAAYDAGLPMLREALLTSLAAGSRSVAQIREAAARYGMALHAPAYALALLRLPSGDGAGGGAPGLDDPELLSFAIENIAAEVLAGRLAHHLFHYDGMLAVLMLLDGADEDWFAQAVDALDEVRVNIEHFLRFPAHVGVGAPAESLSDVPSAARQAASALHQAVFAGDSQTLCYTDIIPGRMTLPPLDPYALASLGNALRLGQTGLAQAAVDNLLDGFQTGELPLSAYQTALLEVLMVFLRAGRELALPPLAEDDGQPVETLLRCPPREQAKALLRDLCVRVTEQVLVSRASSTLRLADQAVAHIESAYMQEDLSMEKVCRHLHISTSYFSALFKKETKKTFLQYLTDLRMDRAMTLLAAGELKTSEIARSVGIGDPSYFSYIFRRHFGISPSQARKRETERA